MKLFKRFYSAVFFVVFVALVGNAQTIQEIKRVSFTVSNLDEAVHFYSTVLPFIKDTVFVLKGKDIQQLWNVKDASLSVKVARLHLGNEEIELMEFDAKKLESREIPADSRSNDLWFQHIAIVVSDMDKAYKVLADKDVTHVSSSPQTLPDYLTAAAGISAFYFRDFDGHNLELIHFPKGKGNPTWQTADNNLFLGIDHTAIGIESTSKSLDFYQRNLKLEVAGKSENYGTEQEHLNQVFGAHLIITGLKSPKGIGLELLNYIAPPGGRKYPSDTKLTDLWYWQTTFEVNGIDLLFSKLKAMGVPLLSDKVVSISTSNPLGSLGFVARDPDGHFLLFIQK